MSMRSLQGYWSYYRSYVRYELSTVSRTEDLAALGISVAVSRATNLSPASAFLQRWNNAKMFLMKKHRTKGREKL